MLLSVVYELTTLPVATRDNIFASTLTKVFLTCLISQLEAMVFANWV
jgi:hypothetical protein